MNRFEQQAREILAERFPEQQGRFNPDDVEKLTGFLRKKWLQANGEAGAQRLASVDQFLVSEF